MKRFHRTAVLCAALLLAFSAVGCEFTGVSPSSEPASVTASPSSPLPLATPEAAAPAPEVYVFGADDSGAFCAGVNAAADGAGIAVTFVPGGVEALLDFTPDGPAAAIVYLGGAADELPRTTLPLYVYAANGQTVPAAIAHLTYRRKGADATALELAIGWPPHETPVRLIGLFTSSSSAAYALWCEAVAAGRVYPKETFFLDDQDMTAASAWLAEQVAAYYPGMLDAVFAETGALAVAALHQELGQGREDFEIFSAGTDSNVLPVLSSVLPAAVGADEEQAGSLCFAAAAALLAGETANSAELTPTTFQFSGNP